MFDRIIEGGTIIDGTGAPRFRGDVGITDGRIAAIGDLADKPARERTDATGLMVAPGFVDAHTHYDAQVFWDPTLSPSCYHGVTTIVGGFCGFSVAPMSKDAASYLMPMLARVEGMPLETLHAALPCDWESFGDYLSRLDGRIGINAGFFAGHSAIRRVVMGARAVGEKATPDDVGRMTALLDKSLSEGALGFSTTQALTHNDGDGNPVPSRWADRDEMLALATVVSHHDGAGLEMLPDMRFDDATVDLLADFSVAGQRPVNWNMITISSRDDIDAVVARQLVASDVARERGGDVVALTLAGPIVSYTNFRTGFILEALPGIWRDLFKGSVADRMVRLRDPGVRAAMQQGLDDAGATGLATVQQFGNYRIISTVDAANKPLEGRLVGSVAEERGQTPLDLMLDIALADGLDTVFQPGTGGDDDASWERRGRLWQDDRVMIGASDAGAHLDGIDTFAVPTTLLARGVREKGLLTLEQAVRKLTLRPATYFGLVDRGTLSVGNHADIVLFDADLVGPGKTSQRRDLPGGGGFRLYAEADGIALVLVNGTPIVAAGRHTGALPGTVLRSGRDTRTMPLETVRAAA